VKTSEVSAIKVSSKTKNESRICEHKNGNFSR